MDKKVYTRCKDGVLSELKSFTDYVDEVEKEAERLEHERFNKMFDSIKDSMDILSAEEMHQLIMLMSEDREVPKMVVEIVSGIGIIKHVNECKDNPKENARLIKLIVEFMREG